MPGFPLPVSGGTTISDFSVSLEQRRRLLQGDYAALTFKTKPFGCDPGGRYVLAWKRASVTVLDEDSGECAVTPAHPVWFITVKKVARVWKGDELVWRVTFDVTDRRDADLWLRRGGGYQSTPRGAVDDLPVAPSDEVRRKAREEFDHLRRLQRHAEERRARGRERSKARRKRAA